MSGCSTPRATADAEWDALFSRADGWNGGDIARSIDLCDGRTLWLFGDSIFGPVVAGSRVGNSSKMFRDAIAWHDTKRGGAPPASNAITFASPEPFGATAVTPWAQPVPGLWPGGTWYWLMNDGVRITATRDHFLLFATAVGPSGNPDGAWNFRRVGGVILDIDSPSDSPDRWCVHQRINPLVTPDPKFGEPARTRENHAVAVVRVPGEGANDLFMFGVRTGSDGVKSLIVGRTNDLELTDPVRWLFFNGSKWTASHEAAAPLFPGAQDECSVHRVRKNDRGILVLVQSEAFLSRAIVVRTARHPQGPWSAPRRVYEAPDNGPGSFVYAAKGHPHLSRPGELLVTYAVNADFGRVFRDASLYRPRFVRVPLGLLPDPP
ncbi:MAG: DUF5005 domain-containing protein [Planctomycetes bacterium]|nr:DUF5005 domain-containing protein [Planctomycetota bacterium]